MKALPPTAEMERAYRESDSSYDGIFCFAVTTTGVFCRPSCAARKPRPENVRYFGSVREALFAGFRPCLRCRPLETPGRPPEWVRLLLESIEADPSRRRSDADLRSEGVNPARARRWFLASTGMTFQAYARARRLGKAFAEIRGGSRLDEVILENGYDSHSGFRDAFARLFGGPPGASRGSECLLAAWLESPLGPLIAAASPRGVCLLEFTERRMLEAQFETLRKRFGRAIVPGRNGHLDRLEEELRAYFAGTLREFGVPLAYPGTPFQQRVWDELRRIPYGRTRSYEDLARALGSPGASRAVGQANGLNRIAILIPCHRVVNKGGRLGGYGGGLWRKRHLLDLERAVVAGSALPEAREQMSLPLEPLHR